MIMPITHVNAKGKTYYLHQGVTKTGKPKYHFAMKSDGTYRKFKGHFSAGPSGAQPAKRPFSSACSERSGACSTRWAA
jgi:hypothetical protein